MNELLPFIVSTLLGFLIGAERQKSHGQNSTMGVRTFTLLAILGCFCGWIGELWITVLIGAFAMSLVLIAYFRERPAKAEFGLTTEVAAALVFILSYASRRDPALVTLLGCLIALLLFWKTPLHKFTAKLRPRELEAFLLLLLLGICVLSLVEDRVIDPWGLFNPRKFGLVILLLGTIEFCSYLAAKLVSAEKSPFIIGGLAGLASSTSLVLTTSKFAKNKPLAWRQYLAMVCAGTCSSLLLLVVVVGMTSSTLLPQLVAMLAGPLLLGTAVVYWYTDNKVDSAQALTLDSPLDVKSVLRLSFLLGAILLVVSLAQQYAGNLGRGGAALIGGLFELQGVSIATATLHARERIDLVSAMRTLQFAVLASFVSKIAIVWMVAKGNFRLAVTVVLLGMAALTTLVLI